MNIFKKKEEEKTLAAPSKKQTLPVISIILDKPSCSYQKNELVTGSVKISNIKRKVNYLSILIKGSYIPSSDPKIHRLYPDVGRLTESVIYEQENLLASNIEIKGILKRRFQFKLYRSSNKDFPENYNGELYRMKYEVRAKGTIDDSNEGIANIEFLLRNYSKLIPKVEKPLNQDVVFGNPRDTNNLYIKYNVSQRSTEIDIFDGLDGQLQIIEKNYKIKNVYACLIRTEWIRTDTKKMERMNAWQHLEICRGEIEDEPLEFFYPFPKNSLCMPHKKHSHFGTEFSLGIKIYFENGEMCTKSFPINFWRKNRNPLASDALKPDESTMFEDKQLS